MTIEKAIRLARKWAAGHVCTLKEGEAQEYHQMCAEALEKSRWISVEERLPQETGEVCRVVNLMMDNGLETAGWLNDITGLGYFLDSRSSFIRQAPISRFTHWMYLPEAPKEDKHGG